MQNASLNKTDFLGLLSVGDVISLLPGLGTLYNAVVAPKGSNPSDYSIDISKKLCCELGSEGAELDCQKSIQLQIAKYEGKYVALTTVHALTDAVVGLLAKHPIVLLKE
ncbi:MAG: hypothetical protein RRC34_00540 [Lentisphaeria bacterium]|nr:hypothetical protein [Lentisphaeria bacterium]